MSRRVVVSLFLLVAILPLFGLISNAPETHGQAFTTITSYTTTPITVTSIRISIVPITGATTFTRSDTTTSSLTQPRKLFSEYIVLASPGPNYGCRPENRAFSAKKGQVVSVSIESNNEVSLYVMTEKDYKNWEKARKCSPGEVSDFTGAFDITSYTEQLVIANDGWYRFVILNFGSGTAAIRFKAEVVGVAYEATFVVTSHVVSLEYSTETITLTAMATGKVVRTEQVGFSLGQNSLLIVAVVSLVAISVVVVILLRRRGHEKPVAAAEVGAPAESQLAAERFCISCGAPLPATMKFCNKCGSKQ